MNICFSDESMFLWKQRRQYVSVDRENPGLREEYSCGEEQHPAQIMIWMMIKSNGEIKIQRTDLDETGNKQFID